MSERQDPEELRQRARQVAVRLFARFGFEGTSVQAIADEVGCSKQVLLYHFSSKEGLREAALQEMIAVWRNVLPRLLALTGAKSPLEGALAELSAFSKAEPAYARFLVQELMRPGAEQHPLLRDVEPWLKMAAGFIRDGQRDGTVDEAVDPEAWVLNLGMFVLAALALLDAGPVRGKPRPERVIRELARILQVSLLKKKPKRRARRVPT